MYFGTLKQLLEKKSSWFQDKWKTETYTVEIVKAKKK